MPRSLDDIADRLEIQDLLARYSDTVDRRAWEELDELFTADAAIDYRELGGPVGGVAEIKTFLRETLAMFSSTMHLLGLPVLGLDGDTAHGRTPCHSTSVLAAGEHEARAVVAVLWYRDTFVRTDVGWRFAGRHTERGDVRVVSPG